MATLDLTGAIAPEYIDISKMNDAFIEGNRTNRFIVDFSLGNFLALSGLDADSIAKIPYLVKSANIPAIGFGKIIKNFQSLSVYYAGDINDTPDWNLTTEHPIDYVTYNAFVNWMYIKHNPVTNVKASSSASYKNPILVCQLANDGSISGCWIGTGAFPTNMGDIQLAYENKNQFATLNVTFSVDRWFPIATNAKYTLAELKTFITGLTVLQDIINIG